MQNICPCLVLFFRAMHFIYVRDPCVLPLATECNGFAQIPVKVDSVLTCATPLV